MTDEKAAETEAVQAVVDRVAAYQDGATEGTVEDELRKGLAEADVDLDDDSVTRLAAAIDDQDGAIDAAAVLGR